MMMAKDFPVYFYNFTCSKIPEGKINYFYHAMKTSVLFRSQISLVQQIDDVKFYKILMLLLCYYERERERESKICEWELKTNKPSSSRCLHYLANAETLRSDILFLANGQRILTKNRSIRNSLLVPTNFSQQFSFSHSLFFLF
jgi:hypothetical protein